MSSYYVKLASLPGKPLSLEEARYHSYSATEQDRLERHWDRVFDLYIRELDETVFKKLWEHGKILDGRDIDFLPIVLEQSIDVLQHGIISARGYVRLAKAAPDTRLPTSFAGLRERWDLWRKRKVVPARQQYLADRLRKAYLNRCQKIWRDHSDEFRQGGVFNQQRVREIIEARGDMARARAETIVRTETTYYYNRGRAIVYDKMPAVGGYLFLAIRDQATTKWCRTRQGLVYLKDDTLAQLERPPIHWNCRSEMVPLLWHNPRHRRLLEDETRNRRNRICEPLPAGWSKR